jgi:hypothetical protein
MEAPMPFDEPVTTATLLESFLFCVLMETFAVLCFSFDPNQSERRMTKMF